MTGAGPSAGLAARRRLRLGWRLLSAVLLVALVVWRLPRFVGAFVILRDLRHLDQAIALEPRGGEAVSEATEGLLGSIDRWEGLDESALTSRMVRLGRGARASMLVGIARFHISQGHPERALEAFRKAVALHPDAMDEATYGEYYELAVQLDPSNGEARRGLAEHLESTGQREEARAELAAAIQNAAAWNLSEDWVAHAHLRLAQLYEADGDSVAALSSYQQALQLNSRLTPAMAGLAELYRQAGDAGQAQHWQSRLAELVPEHAVGQAVGDEWLLVGYDLDERTLVDGWEAEIALYWLPPSPLETLAAAGWYPAGDHWVQVTWVRNLVANGGFEEAEAGAPDLPSGWYVTPDSQAELPAHAAVERGGAVTQVASLRGPGLSALCPAQYPIHANAIYLHSAWVRSDGTAAAVGCLWKVAGANDWTYIVRQAQDSAWTHYVGVETHTGEAAGCQPCVYKRGEGGEAQFDDVVLIELELPDTGLGR